MIQISCESADTIKLMDLVPFQGNLKKRTEEDLKELEESITNHGLLMPFAVWKHEGKNYLLDGHGRREVLLRMAVNGTPEVLSTEWPCVYVEAATEDDAKKALLTITSQYGKLTKAGVKQFTASIPSFVAPSIKKFVTKVPKVVPKVSTEAPQKQSTRIIKIRVSEDKVSQLLDIFKQFEYIEVM